MSQRETVWEIFEESGERQEQECGCSGIEEVGL